MEKCKIERLANRVLWIPDGYGRVTDGNVLAGDIVWWETTDRTPSWHPAAELCEGSKSVGRTATSMHCVARPAVKPARGAEITERCGHCGTVHPIQDIVFVSNSAASALGYCPACAARLLERCGRCGRVSLKSANVKIGEGRWCVECTESHSEACECCGGRVPKESLADVTRPGMPAMKYCPACVVKKAVQCTRCGAFHIRTSSVTVDGMTWCATCSDNHSHICFDCGTRTRNYTQLDGNWYCYSCLPPQAPPSSSGRSDRVYGYHGFGAPKKFYGAGKDSDALFMGFELEAGGTTATKRNDAATRVHALSEDECRFHMESDGSIPEYGFELISAPMTLAAHQEFAPVWEKVLKEMLRGGMRSHDLSCRCGLHVHVSRKALPADSCAKLDMFLQRNKKFWEHIARRTESSYAKFIDKGNTVDRYGTGTDRYASLNLTNTRTVEFRLFRGSLKFSTLMGTLEVVDGVCKWIATRSAGEICDNKGETDKFMSFLKADPVKYGNAVAYATASGAATDAENQKAEFTPPEREIPADLMQRIRR